MANWILFETTDSVIEILWDVALAFFVVRLAALYAALALLLPALLFLLQHSSSSSSPPSSSSLSKEDNSPHLLAPWIVTPLAALAAAWFLASKYDLPRVWPFRLAMGVSGAVVGLGMEVLVGWGGYELFGWEGGMGGWAVIVGGGGGGGGGGGWEMGVRRMVGMAAMPVLVMGLERWLERWLGMGAAVLRHRRREKMGDV
ncbi:hypothetical protein N658DRAFT_125485 [Parathielavia hyrcaniae]|uniref:Uncharacterized protein n=1 Tax=Parathielavia hyrcaniae TaxID=113614 RepID=A0AAN6T6B7_9PEZI|nr:hypothetical protein N658DRAFT_125485 [Parathielavia hyrcaniae]